MTDARRRLGSVFAWLVLPTALAASCSGSEEGGESPATGGQSGTGPTDAASDGSATGGGAGWDGGGDSAADALDAPDVVTDATGDGVSVDDADANAPPVALLSYEIELNQWVAVKAGDTVVRPLDVDINWNACASYDPDGKVAEIWLKTASLEQLLGPNVSCQEHTQNDHTPKNLSGYLLVKDDQGAETKLTFKYVTQ